MAISALRDKRLLHCRGRPSPLRADESVSVFLHNGSRMNRFERQPTGAVEARVEFHDGDFRVIRPGAFVRCAVTGLPIPLDELRYWSVDRQEAYVNPDAVLRRLGAPR
jgi:hypothetical protein